MSSSYDFSTIEPAWQRAWSEHRAFAAANPGEPGADRPPYYVLDFFPYPSGAGLHVGHPLGYIGTDIIARYKRMRGFNVLHPMGWDAFGLPAEQYAVETGVHPAVTTKKNIETYTRQLKMIGLSFDWAREFATCTPDYYRWTQWIFLQIYNSWYDPKAEWTDSAGRKVVGRARPIAELEIPADVRAGGAASVAKYQDNYRLAFLAEVPVNWCPGLGTVLANEEVTADGRSERGNFPVFHRPMKQWMLRITQYADRLLSDLEPLDWPESVKLMQREWIGRSEGAYVEFPLAAGGGSIRVFTTRPDTLYGATYVVLAPEHKLVAQITTPDARETVERYVTEAKRKSDLTRTADSKQKTGVFTGAYAINPVSGEQIPIWAADYVLATYGTGAIMAVPGSDTRDLAFADAMNLPVVQVVAPPSGEWRGFEGLGTAVNSPTADVARKMPHGCALNGLGTLEAKHKMIAWLEARGVGVGTVQYRLRDWLFSRQRYWGEPFPVAHDEAGLTHAIPERDLPVLLPEMEDFKPVASDDPDADPQTPLSRAAHWMTFASDGRRLRREANTMPNWAGSCWYYLRFCDPKNASAFVDARTEQYWATGGKPSRDKTGLVDLYVGGAEHAVLHLLYARFWHKVLYDLGHVSTPEPFQKLFNQGMIGAAAYRDERGVAAPAAEVSEGPEVEMAHPFDVDEQAVLRAVAAGMNAADAQQAGRRRIRTTWYHQGQPVMQTFEKMSKTLKNVVNPDEIIREYGADTLRLYEMYMGPLEASKPWNTRDIIGVHRFLQRVWRLVVGESDEGTQSDGATERRGDGVEKLNSKIGAARNEALERSLHKTIKKVQGDIESFGFNTAIAQMIVWVNEAQKAESIGRDQVVRFLQVLAPFAPHLCEELNRRLGETTILARVAWPAYDDALTRDEAIEAAVQINNTVCAKIMIAADADEKAVAAAALADAKVQEKLAGRTLRRDPIVRKSPKGLVVNLVV